MVAFHAISYFLRILFRKGEKNYDIDLAGLTHKYHRYDENSGVMTGRYSVLVKTQKKPLMVEVSANITKTGDNSWEFDNKHIVMMFDGARCVEVEFIPPSSKAVDGIIKQTDHVNNSPKSLECILTRITTL